MGKTSEKKKQQPWLPWQHTVDEKVSISICLAELPDPQYEFEDSTDSGAQDRKRDKITLVRSEKIFVKEAHDEFNISDFESQFNLVKPFSNFLYYFNHQDGFSHFAMQTFFNQAALLSEGFMGVDKVYERTLTADESGLVVCCEEQYTVKSLFHNDLDKQQVDNVLDEKGIKTTAYQTEVVKNKGEKTLIKPTEGAIFTVTASTKITYDKNVIKLELSSYKIEAHSPLADIILPNKAPISNPVEAFKDMGKRLLNSIKRAINAVGSTYATLSSLTSSKRESDLTKSETSSKQAACESHSPTAEEFKESIFILPKKRCLSADTTDAKRSKKTVVGDYITNSMKINR